MDAMAAVLERKDTERLKSAFGGYLGVLEQLQADPDQGIPTSSVASRREKYGANELAKKEPVTFLEFFIEACSDKIIIILAIAASVSIVFGMTLPDPHSGKVNRAQGWIEGTAVIISILVVTLVGSINNYQKAKKFEELEAEQSVLPVQVIRDGKELTVDSTEIVVGDIIVLESGSRISCDCLLLRGTHIKCDESAMTGEPDLIKKSEDRDPFLLSGTLLNEGSGLAVVVAVGMNSFQGKVKAALNEDATLTPLQEHLEKLADLVGILGLVGAIVLVAALFIKEGVAISHGKEATATSFLNYVILAITVIVVAIPEGLPLAVTITLAFSMKAIMKDNCMVRVLASCETMGAATAICSDKTGTLTTNKMTVVQGLVNDVEFVIDGYGLKPRTENVVHVEREHARLPVDASSIIRAISLNSSAREQLVDGKIVWIGNKTEHGLLGFVNMMNEDYKKIRESVPASDQRQYPFNSEKKRMTTIARESGGTKIYVKGASEIVLQTCTQYLDKSGSVCTLTADKAAEYLEVINDMADQGNRTIGVAYCDCVDGLPEDEPDVQNLVFLGVLGIQDPIRPEVPEAVLKCRTAGITVRMVTGDNINTAIAIAKKCNIYVDDGWSYALTGPEFREMFNTDKERLLELLPRLRVLARSSPQDKYILVGLLQEQGEVVGVTGDGTNDAPALKLANVGFAMQCGTDIAKGAADMVVLDDNFASVVNAARWGRSVNDNIRKFLQFQLAINVGGVILTVIGSLASSTNKEPLTPVQLLWLNLIMDTLAALALATEGPDDGCLNRLPVFKQAPLISPRMWVFIVLTAVIQVGIIFIHMFSSYEWLQTVEGSQCDIANNNRFNAQGNVTVLWQFCHDACRDAGGTFDSDRWCQQGSVHSTIIFNTFIWMQVFNIFNARLLFGGVNPFSGLFTRSINLCLVVLLTAGFQVFAVEAAGAFMQTVSLTWKNWLICIAFGATMLPLGVIMRFLPVWDAIPAEITAKWEKEEKLRQQLGVGSDAFEMSLRHDGTASHFHVVKKDPLNKRLGRVNSGSKGKTIRHCFQPIPS